MSKYRTAPDQELTTWPRGISFIIGNEASERFSYYGMRAILATHLTTLFVATGLAEKLAEKHATHDTHIFFAGVYAMPVIGAILADKLFGKYLTIMSLSLVYCAGHGVLALGEDSLPGMHLGLLLIAIGAGGIKPCVSANVGDQFGRANWHLTKKVFQFFYLSINFGSLFSTLLTPFLLTTLGPRVAFGVPGGLMLLATLIFWAGRYRFVHVPPRTSVTLGVLDALVGSLLFVGVLAIWIFGPEFGLAMWLRGVISVSCVVLGVALFFYRQGLARDDGFLATVLNWAARGRAWTTRELGTEAVDGAVAVFRIMFVFVSVSVFWSLFDQHASTWVFQAESMDRHVDLGLFHFELLPQQTQSTNPALVLLLIPVLLYGVFPALERRGIKITPLRRMSVGMFLAAVAFVGSALIQRAIDAGGEGAVSWLWQLVPYSIMTLAEVLVSATGLEFAYTQAPPRMKSTIMSFWLFTTTIGDVLVAVIALLPRLEPEGFFWLFAGLMAAAAAVFLLITLFYRYRDYPQGG
ncbi:MAG TPA: oligopeptide:H+ symporter [Kofleriaceae bacterium]|nr:oligopeptide:H+ symporter [Kofleriaceae bacterium]